MPKLSRADQVLENDRRIRESLRDLVVERGWDEITVAAVARQAGVTVGAVYARAENLAELANDVWSELIEAPLEAFITEMMAAAESGDADRLRALSASVDRDHRDLLVALELIVASLFDDELAEVVGARFGAMVQHHTVPVDASLDAAHRSAARFLVLSFMFGRLLAYQSGDAIDAVSGVEASILCGYVAATPVPVNSANARPITFTLSSERDESTRRAVIQVVGRWGYRRATLARIARAAGIRPGVLFAGYSSKAELVADAATGLVASPIQIWRQYDEVVASMGSPRARAVFLSQYLDPSHVSDWKIRLELARLSHKVPGLAAFQTPADPLQRTHLGVLLIGCFTPGAAELPFEGAFQSGVAV